MVNPIESVPLETFCKIYDLLPLQTIGKLHQVCQHFCWVGLGYNKYCKDLLTQPSSQDSNAISKVLKELNIPESDDSHRLFPVLLKAYYLFRELIYLDSSPTDEIEDKIEKIEKFCSKLPVRLEYNLAAMKCFILFLQVCSEKALFKIQISRLLRSFISSSSTIQNCSSAIIKYLLEKGAINSTFLEDGEEEAEENTSIHIACRMGSLSVVTTLLDHGINPDFPDESHATPLHSAALAGQTEIVRLLLEKKANVNATNNIGETPLHWAIRQPKIDTVKLFLEHKEVNVNAKDESGGTPFDEACAQGSIEIMELLLKYQAKPNLSKQHGPIHIACNKGFVEVVAFLIRLGSPTNVEDDFGDHPLHIAIVNNHTEIVKILVEAGADINCKKGGFTPLHMACYGGPPEIVQLLLSKGAKVDETAENGKTALHTACKHAFPEIVRLLLKFGASITVQNNKNLSPIAVACNHNRPEILECLLSKIESENADSLFSFIFSSAQNGFHEILKLLLEKDSQDYHLLLADSPLIDACKNNRPICVKVYLEHYASKFQKVARLKDIYGTAFKIACKNQFREIMSLFIQCDIKMGCNVLESSQKGDMDSLFRKRGWPDLSEFIMNKRKKDS